MVQEVWHEASALWLKQKYQILYKTLRYADPQYYLISI